MQSSDSNDGDDDTDDEDGMGNSPKQQLVTKFQLRLVASHLPKIGRRLGRLAGGKEPDTFATVTSIVAANEAAAKKSGRSLTYKQGMAVGDKGMVEWGSTEVVPNSRCPQWVQTIPLTYEYGSELHFYVRILQAEKRVNSPSNHKTSSATEDFSICLDEYEKNRTGYCFGSALFEVGDILGSRNNTKVKRLKSGGCVYARIEPVQEDRAKQRFRFRFQARNLVLPGNRRFGFSSYAPDTILELARRHSSSALHSWVTVFRSRPIYSSFDPSWDVAELDLGSCCLGDLGTHMKISVYEVKRGVVPKLIGICETKMQNIISAVHSVSCDYDDYSIAPATAGRSSTLALSSDARDVVGKSELGFILQRNNNKLKEVGRLRILAAKIVTLSGRSLPEAFEISGLDSIVQLTPPKPSQDGSVQTPSAATPTTIAATTSPWRTISSESTSGDGLTVDLKLFPDSFASREASYAYTMTLNEYIDSGGELDFCVAIDFTSSNGNPLQEGTLHFQSDEALNDYEETITSIGAAIDKYNPSSECCVWGFGAKFGDGILRHLFQCGPTPTVSGVDGILQAYRSIFRGGGITMSGPTVFIKAIQAAAVRARKYKEMMAHGTKRYCILLIITDGIMDNFEESQQKLAVYGEVPLSVVFVGVGRADFRVINQLCHQRSFPSPQLTRPNATFVEFRQHQDDPKSLATAALKNIPSQLTEYMVQNGVQLSNGRR